MSNRMSNTWRQPRKSGRMVGYRGMIAKNLQAPLDLKILGAPNYNNNVCWKYQDQVEQRCRDTRYR